jgi:uncharacterized RDD family membrane protein YckC
MSEIACACYRQCRVNLETMLRVQLEYFIVRLVVFAGIAWSFVWTFWVQHEDIGSFTEVKNGVTYVSAATNPLAILMSVTGLVVYFILLNARVKVENFSIAPMWKRAAAFVVDFWFAAFTLAALFGFFDILLEASRTGVFRWHYQRDYLVASDRATIAFVVAGLAAFVAYFLLPLMRCSQTIGGWIFRLATLNSDGSPVYLPPSIAARRLFAEFRGLISPLRTLRKRDEQGRTFYDIESGFTVVSY